MPVYSFKAHRKRLFKDFPEYKDSIFIVNTDQYKSFYSYARNIPSLVNSMDTWSEDNVKNYDEDEFNEHIKATRKDKSTSCASVVYFDKKDAPVFIASWIHISKTANAKFQKSFHSYMRQFKSSYSKNKASSLFHEIMLDHEIGHALFDQMVIQASISKMNAQKDTPKNASGKAVQTENSDDAEISPKQITELTRTIMSEAVAESYALIRSYQRMGADNVATKSWIAARAADRMIFAFDAHNFTPAIHEVTRRAKLGEFEKISPEDALQKAIEIGLSQALSFDDVNNIGKSLKQACDAFSKKDIDAGCSLLKQAATKTDHPAVLNDIQYTAQFLKDTLRDKTPVKQVWNALAQKKSIRKGGYLKQHWHAVSTKDNANDNAHKSKSKRKPSYKK